MTEQAQIERTALIADSDSIATEWRALTAAPPLTEATPQPAPLPLPDGLKRSGIGRPLLLVDSGIFVASAAVVGWHWQQVLLLALTLTLYSAAGLYRSRLTLSAVDDLPSLVGRAVVAGAIVTALAQATGFEVGVVALQTSILFAVLALCGRAFAYHTVRRARSTGRVCHETLILGAGQVGGQLAQTLLDHREYGLAPIGFLDNDPLLRPEDQPVPVLGDLSELATIMRERGVRVVVVAFGSMRESGVVDLLRTCDRLRAEIFFVPRLYELHAVSKDMELVWGIPLVRLRRAAFRTIGWRFKRMMDAVLAAVALVALSPVMAACAAMVRLKDGPGGVLFKQERVGLDGRSFTVLKFRTLRPATETENAVRWNVADDARLGPVGRFLRKTSLDELPQLWNVVRGDMSLVGPRPERPFFVNEFTHRFPRYMARHRVPAGMTGWAQVHGLRGDTSIADRARFDNYYIENWSLWEDVKILLRTTGQVVRGSGG